MRSYPLSFFLPAAPPCPTFLLVPQHDSPEVLLDSGEMV